MLVIQIAERNVLLPQLAQLSAATTPATLVFSSPFAARALQLHFPELLSRHPLLTVGASTAAALAPYPARLPSESEGAQALLDILPSALTSQSFCLIQAPDALPMLQVGLSARGAQIQIIEAYARIRSPMHVDERDRLLNLRCTDIGSGAQLEALLNAGLPLTTPLILPSERVKNFAESLGFSELLVVSNSSESERLQNLSVLLSESRPNN